MINPYGPCFIAQKTILDLLGCFGGVCGPAGGGDGKRVLRTIFVNEEAHDALQVGEAIHTTSSLIKVNFVRVFFL